MRPEIINVLRWYVHSSVHRAGVLYHAASLICILSHYTKLRLTFWFVCSWFRWLFCAKKCYLRYLIGAGYLRGSCIRRGCSACMCCLFLTRDSDAALL